MSQELLQLLEWRRELGAANELVDMFLGKEVDGRLRRRLALLSVKGYKAEGASLADRLTRAKFRLALMKRYGNEWKDCAEWKAHKASGKRLAPMEIPS